MKNYKELIKDAGSLLKGATPDIRSHNDSGKIIAAAVIGLAAGAILGILFAPSAGADTRSTIADSLNSAGGTLKDKAKQGVDKLADLKDQAVSAVKSKVQGSADIADP